MIFPSWNFLLMFIKHEISPVVHSNVSLHTNKQTNIIWPTYCKLLVRWNHLQLALIAAGYTLSRTYKLTVIHSLVTCSLLYFPQDFPLLVIIFLTFSTSASHGSTNTSARCDSIRIKPDDRWFIQRAPGRDTARTQRPVSPPRLYNCGHRKNGPGQTFKNNI